jgi:hypothetical protein
MKQAISPLIIVGLLLLVVAAKVEPSLNITGYFGGEPAVKAQNASQTADWIQCVSNGVSVFEVPANGIIPTSYGGTGQSYGSTVVATNASFPSPIAGNVIYATSNYDLYLVTPTKTNRIVAGS